MDHLWPLIISHNICDINSTNTSGYFVPQQKFDHIWAHELLASKKFGDYQKPIELQCKQTNQQETPVHQEENEIDQLPYNRTNSKILPLDQQLEIIQHNVEIRQKLAKNFANRKFPWYIPQPSYCKTFQITNEIRHQFKDSLEYEILQNIQRCQCHLMIIDVAASIPLKNLEKFLKFSPYVALVVVIHDKVLFRKIKNFNSIFLAVLMEEHMEANWQEKLNRSLDLGITKAKELFLWDDSAEAFVFVFSNNPGICVWDKFKILRKF